MTDKEKLNALLTGMKEIEEIADCAKGLHDDNMDDALREILALARKVLKITSKATR